MTEPQTSFRDRRGFLRFGGVLSASAVAVLAGATQLAKPASAQTTADDAAILNTALSAELEAIAAYQVGAESGLLQPAVLDLAVVFQGHHREHADLLGTTVTTLGGTPVDPVDEYVFPVDQLTDQAAVLQFAADLERGAVSAYFGAIPLFSDSGLAQAAASILADEAMHWAVLRGALGQDPVPSAFIS